MGFVRRGKRVVYAIEIQQIKNIQDLNHMEEVIWRQKSRVSCLKEGDKNRNFFHCMASVRNIINFIGKIKKGSCFIEKPEDVKEEIASFFLEFV